MSTCLFPREWLHVGDSLPDLWDNQPSIGGQILLVRSLRQRAGFLRWIGLHVRFSAMLCDCVGARPTYSMRHPVLHSRPALLAD
jgi:hypothetical protein